MKTDHGDMFTDFDVKLDPTPSLRKWRTTERQGGRIAIQLDRGTNGTINGGGPEMQFTTFNGNILIHKK